MRMPEIVWESYHSGGRPRNTPLPSTIHGWLTKMRGTLLDNETIRYRGIKEMKQAAAVRILRQKEEAERKLRNLARANAGRSPLQPVGKQPWLRLSFLRNRPKPIARGSTRPVATTRRLISSAHTQNRRPHLSSSRSRHNSTSGNRSSKRHPTSRKSSHASRASKWSSKDRSQPNPPFIVLLVPPPPLPSRLLLPRSS
ncbi:hypothetical protein BDM02DRAFT_3111176 [Thelephora ganbajun]|uniref:Uncharacterized protein n=1 Tax=Thelephora ganbajun TaxID=370292 RepID=A0ACB6ZNL4_THEGA|nr:hypothetical protein BDM02DRAFT_3111176 [Thelephora ganbajun]